MRLFLSLLLPLSFAAKDSDYYYPGVTNPNLKHDLYWKDSINVLQDLDQFDKLYIEYHGCVWTKYGTHYGNGQNYDEQGQNQDQNDQDSYGNGCGGWGGEHFWYLGRTQCFKANVAYSLYGILKGRDDVGCGKATYINSFFTTFGAESFTGPLGLGSDSGNSYCTAIQGNENGNQDNRNNDDDMWSFYAADDDYVDDNYQFVDFSSYTSTGTGCTADGSFTQDLYKGAFCHGSHYLETVDALSNFNGLLQQQSCTQIYSSGNDQDYEQPDYDDDQGYDFDNMNAVHLLSFSKSCSLRQYPKDCPDPYGLKRKYARAMEQTLGFRTGSQRTWTTHLCRIGSGLLVLVGLMLLCVTCGHVNQLQRKEQPAGRRRRHKAKKTIESAAPNKETLAGMAGYVQQQQQQEREDATTKHHSIVQWPEGRVVRQHKITIGKISDDDSSNRAPLSTQSTHSGGMQSADVVSIDHTAQTEPIGRKARLQHMVRTILRKN